MDSLQQLDVCHSAETERRDEKKSARIHEKKAVPADQDKRASGGKCGPKSLPRHCKRPILGYTDDANLSETLRYVMRRRSLEMGHAGAMMRVRDGEW